MANLHFKWEENVTKRLRRSCRRKKIGRVSFVFTVMLLHGDASSECLLWKHVSGSLRTSGTSNERDGRKPEEKKAGRDVNKKKDIIFAAHSDTLVTHSAYRCTGLCYFAETSHMLLDSFPRVFSSRPARMEPAVISTFHLARNSWKIFSR